jgi:hypothetical protein
VTAFRVTVTAGLPFGVLLGAVFGPLRLAGVDYSAWFRNPAELSEGNDHTWIGLAKGVALNIARLLVAAVFVFWVAMWACDDVQVIQEANARYRAEPPARGELQDSRSLFWKIIASPVPRPVGITDPTERIHQTAFDRQTVATVGDPYAGYRRRAWLQTIPEGAREGISAYEAIHAFAGPGTGTITQRLVRVNQRLCDRVLSWFVGEA